MNCTSHLSLLENCFTTCIQVLRGKFSAKMQDYQISMPIRYGGILHKGSSFLLEAPRPLGCSASGALQFSQWAAEIPWKSRKSRKNCSPSMLAGRQHCPVQQEWSWKDQTQLGTIAPTVQSQGALSALCCWMVQSQTSEVLWTFTEPTSHLKYCQKLSSPF